MPRGTIHEIEGLSLADATCPIQRPDGGRQWRLDLPRGLCPLIGRRMRVIGMRSGFDMLDAIEGHLPD